MNALGVLLGGFLATAIMTTIMTLSQKFGLTRVSFPYLIGTAVSANRDRALVWGYAIHMVVGWAVAVVYVAFFEYLNRATWQFGAALGFIHGTALFVTLMPVLPGIHPRMASEQQGPEPTKALEPPGVLGLNYGKRTPLIGIAAHVVYGLVLGAVYQIATSS